MLLSPLKDSKRREETGAIKVMLRVSGRRYRANEEGIKKMATNFNPNPNLSCLWETASLSLLWRRPDPGLASTGSTGGVGGSSQAGDGSAVVAGAPQHHVPAVTVCAGGASRSQLFSNL